MIITSPIPLPVGKIITEKELRLPFDTPDARQTKYRMMILAEATAMDYTKYIQELYPEEVWADFIYHDHFYRISMD